MAQFELRQFKDADKSLADLIMSFQNESAYEIATVYANRNDFENTMLWLERALTQSERSLQAVKVDPQFKPFRQHPRFKALTKKMNFPE